VNLLSQPVEIKVTFAVWQMMRDLGFPSENLYVGVVEGNLLVSVNGMGQDFSVSVGRTKMRMEDFAVLWTRLATQAETLPDWQIKENFKKHITPQMRMLLLHALDVNGVPVPNAPRAGRAN
jgi:hypothetical protein